jgi:hypothetical protein
MCSIAEGLQPLVTQVDALINQAEGRGKIAAYNASQQHLQKLPDYGPKRASVISGHLQEHDTFSVDSVGHGSSTTIAHQLNNCPGQPAALCSCSRSTKTTGQCGSVQSAGHMLQHKPISSLLAATVMWQHDSDASFRPPLRQCLTTTEIAQQQRL